MNDKTKSELVTSDVFPDTLSDPVKTSKKWRDDPLYKKRKKKDPDLKNNIKKVGENKMGNLVTFTSKDSSAITRQWHLMFDEDDKSWNSWDISNVEVSGDTYSFTIRSFSDDQRMNMDYFNFYKVAGVTIDIKELKDSAQEERQVVESLMEMELDPTKMADILLAEEVSISEKDEEDDSKDGESNKIDKVQTMLTKMLPMTKDLKLSKEDEEELSKLMGSAMSIMKGKKNQG